MAKTKIKQVSYERLESDPHGFNNTRISMVADIEEKENSIEALNNLKKLVDERLYAYEKYREIKREISSLENQISYKKDLLIQIKLTDDDKERINRLEKDVLNMVSELQKFRKQLNTIIG